MCSKETLDALHKHIPGLKDAADDDKLARVAQHLQTMSDIDAEDAGMDAGAVQTMSVADIHTKAVANRGEWKKSHAQLADLATAKEKAEAKVLEMSRAAEVKEPTDLEVTLATESLDALRDAALQVIDPATVTAFEGMFRDNGKPNRLCMSKVGATGNELLGFKALKILAKAKPVSATGSKTGVQTMSRVDPDAGGDTDSAKKIRERMIAKANGEEK